MSRRRWPVFGLLLLTGALVLASLLLAVLNGSSVLTSDWGSSNVVYALVLSALVYPTMGALIALRRPGNSVGWICLGIGVALGYTGFASEYARYALVTSPGSLPGGLIAAWVDNWGWVYLRGTPRNLFAVVFSRRAPALTSLARRRRTRGCGGRRDHRSRCLKPRPG